MTPSDGDVADPPADPSADLPEPEVIPVLPETVASDPAAADGPAITSDVLEPPHVPLLTIRGGLPRIVEDEAGVAELVDRFRSGSGPVAVDAERASGYRYSQRAYLIQLRREGVGSVLIDPIPLGPVPNVALAPLSEAMADAEWVIHAASQDLACLAEVGMRPVHLFDTELAGRLLNYPRVGLAALVEELLGYRMRKEHSAVDWSRRPLPESWLTYAALDVEPLIELREILAAQLEEAGKAEWAAQEFEAWVSMPAVAPRTDPWRRTSGIHRVKGRRGLALVRAMWQLRADIARKRDVTTNRILNDATIVEAAQAAPASRHALSQITGFATRGGQRYLREFHSAITAARALPEEDLPPLAGEHDGPPPPRTWGDRNPDAAVRLAACRESVSSLAESLNLPQENLVSPSAVRRLAWSPPRPPTAHAVADRLAEDGARPWQVALTAEPLAAALDTVAD